MRVAINDYKPEKKTSEYGELSRVLRSEVHVMADMRQNPFDLRLFLRDVTDRSEGVYESGLIGMAKMLSEYEDGDHPLSSLEYYTLRVAMLEMVHGYHEEGWSPDELLRIWSSLTPEMLEYYHAHLDGKLEKESRNRIERVKDDAVRGRLIKDLQQLLDRPYLIEFDDIKQAAKTGSARLGNLLEGALGSMFGQKHSLYDLRTQPVYTMDWRGMGERAESLMRMIDMSITSAAGELNRDDLLPHISVDDERHKGMSNIMYARVLSFMSEIARGIHTFNIGATHAYDSIRKGDVTSETYKLGDRLIDNTGLSIYGKVTPTMVSEMQKRERLTPITANRFPQMPQYTFGAKLQGEEEPMVIFRTIATPKTIVELLPTNSASEGMVEGYDIFDPGFLAEYAAANNLKLAI